MSSRKMSESGWRPRAVTVAVEHEAAAGVGAPAHDQHPHALGQLGQGRAELLVELQALGELGEAQRRFVLVGQRAAARGAEVRPGLVLVAALAASHGRRLPRRPGEARSPDRHPRREARARLEVDGEVEVEVEGCRETLDQRVGHDAHGSVGAPELRQRHGGGAQPRRVTPGAPGERRGGRSRRTGAGRGGSSRAGGPRRRAAPGPTRTPCGPPPAGRRPAGRRSTPGPRGRRGGRSRPSTPSRARPAIEPAGEEPVDGVDAARGARGPRHRDRVREVGAVQQRPARRSAGARPRPRAGRTRRRRRRRRAGSARARAPAATSGRAAAPAARRRRPRRAAPSSAAICAAASSATVEVVDQAPGLAGERWRGQPSSTSARYAAASSSASTSAGSAISTTKIQPAP